MRLALCVLVATALTATLVGQKTSIDFEKDQTGKAPAGWTATQTGTGRAVWTIEKDDTASGKSNVLKQSGVATYPICLKDDTSVKDGSVEVKFKAIAGKEDRAAGLIWRAKDANNYYVARANALEDNVAIYDTVNGRRTERKRTNTKVASNQWHTLRVEFRGSHFAVMFDGTKAIEWDDSTFADAGKLGVWTKADSVTEFDDFSYSATSTNQSATSGGPTVVFVCEHGAAKSVIATAYFNRLARERGLPYRATFRGTDPQAELSVSALKGLREDGMEIPDGKPTVISPADVEKATHVFAIGCTLPSPAAASGKAGSWSDVPDGEGYARTRDAIVRHVTALLDDLQKSARRH